MAGLDGSIQGQFALDVQGLDRLKHSAARDPQKQLRSAAEQFEALFLHRMIKSMRDATPRSELTDSSQMRFYQSLFDQQMSQHMSQQPAKAQREEIPAAGFQTEIAPEVPLYTSTQ